jgi:hypothetical protein
VRQKTGETVDGEERGGGVGKSFVNWKGGAAAGQIEQALSDALVEVAQRIEGEAKKELYPGHGKVTGTLQRSIHAASSDYNFRSDHVKPGAGTPDRGGAIPVPRRSGNRFIVAVGTGMEYAMAVHLRYGYLRVAFNRISPRVLDIVRRYIARYTA